MATALVTGATAGIGEAFARLLGSKGINLVIVARDQDRLNNHAAKWRQEFNIEVEVLSADLSENDGVARVEARLHDEKNLIDILINNAGFAIKESFFTSQLSSELQMVDVMIRAPMRFMHAVLPRMKAQNSGTIINVSSVATWLTSGTYSASKSYLTVLSESLHVELTGTQVRVLALCPGFTHTEFHSRAKMRMSGLPEFMWLNADQVVAAAWSDAQAGKAISIPGLQYRVLTTFARYAPRPLVRRLGVKVRVRQRKN
ncbi:MAG: SDR family oxidoreductase [Actinomycetes bacterium]